MKLVRFGLPGLEKPGIMHNNRVLDASVWGEDYGEQFFASNGLSRLSEWLNRNLERLPAVEGGIRMGSPVLRPSKIICIGLNYADHAKEANMELPKEPVVFFKSTTALCGPNDDLVIPRGSEKTDWEVELAVVIGKNTSYVKESDAMSHVAGFCLHNDYSERAFQLERGGQWVKGKSADTFAPLGPCLVTPDEMGDINNLRLWLTVNGVRRQDGNTANMVYKVPFLISYLSQFMTLLPGDVISTGTPAGVGMGFKPPIYLKSGDVVELGIDHLGAQRQSVRGYDH